MCLSVTSMPRSAPGPLAHAKPCSATEQAAVIALPVPGDSFWQCLVTQMGLFWQAESWPCSYFFLECAGPCKHPRLYGKPCHLLQGFGSTGSCTVLLLGCAQSSPAWSVLFGMLPTAPLQQMSGAAGTVLGQGKARG